MGKKNKTANKFQRECQPCTACCDGWVRMEIEGVAVYPGSPCPHSTGKGCDAYATRPVDPCHHFNCGWVQEYSPLPEWMRPDLAGVMILPEVRHWQGMPVDVAVPVGKHIPPRALNWLKQFAEQHMRPLLYMEQDAGEKELACGQNVIGYGPPEFQSEMAQRSERGEKLW